jgi:hypothetical protein
MSVSEGTPAATAAASAAAIWVGVRRTHVPAFSSSMPVLALILALFVAWPANAEPVDLQLVLAVDVSRSVDDAEYQMQKSGYVAAFASRAVIEAVESGFLGRVAVTYVEWSGNGRQRQLVPWTVVHDPASSLAFADAIAVTRRAYADFTAVGGAIDFSVRLLETSGHDSRRRVIDVSGDGVSNAGAPPRLARDRAVAAGIVINALAIVNEQRRLDSYFDENVVGGPGCFTMVADDFEDFRLAIVAKLVREIAALPPPRRHAGLAEP